MDARTTENPVRKTGSISDKINAMSNNGFTSSWLMSRGFRTGEKQPKPSKAVEIEAELHEAIAAYCKSKMWLAFHSRMDRKNTATAGMPDFVILMSNGKTLFIEAKAKSGKLSTEQLGVKLWAQKLGHTIHTVYSMEGFMNAISTDQNQ